MSHIPAECQALKDEIDSLTKEKNDTAKELNDSGNAHAIAAETHALNTQINRKKAQLNKCYNDHGYAPTVDTFAGTAELKTTDAKAAGPFDQQIVFIGTIGADRSHITISGFPPITAGPFTTPLGPNTTTVTLTGGGSGTIDEGTGSITIPITLHFSQSIGAI